MYPIVLYCHISRLLTLELLADFQLMNSPRAFRAERLSWRAVVQLNVVRSIRLVLDAIADAAEAQGLSLTSISANNSSAPTPTSPSGQSVAHLPSPTSSNGRSPASDVIYQEDLMTPAHVALRARLLPLLSAEAVLLSRLMPVAAASGTSLREIENSHAPSSSSSSIEKHGSSAF